LENWHSDSLKKDQLTLSQGKKKKGDDVADDEDDDVVRTSVSQVFRTMRSRDHDVVVVRRTINLGY
jgi:hypothetical protein